MQMRRVVPEWSGFDAPEHMVHLSSLPERLPGAQALVVEGEGFQGVLQVPEALPYLAAEGARAARNPGLGE